MNAAARWLAALLLVVAPPLFAQNKILRVTFQAAETGFDPVRVTDYYSGMIIEAIYDTLLGYDYLARPAKLVPRAAEAMPQVSADGKTYTFKIRKGVYFTDDPAFKGKKRELTAQDYAYSFRRFFDPKFRSPYAFLFTGKIVGLDALGEQAKKTGKFDYEALVAGLQTPDRYTLVIRLAEPDVNFQYVMAFPLTSGVAREVVEAYGEESSAHPVGTGPFYLQRYVRSSKIVLATNRAYRGMTWDFDPGDNPRFKEIADRMRGKRLPAIDGVEISIMEETQSRWLAFQRGETDIEYQLWEVSPTFMTDDGRLKPEFERRGIKLDRTVDPEIIYMFFNMQDKINDAPNPVGGFGKERMALRRAIMMAYKVDDLIRIIRKGQAVRAQYPIPPDVAGHDRDYRASVPYDPRAANALLERYGYKKGPDGYRHQPNGQPLTITYTSTPTERDRQFDELTKRALDSIGLRMEIRKERFPEYLKSQKRCRVMFGNSAWIADYPDGDNFMQLLYGPNIGESNNACYKSAEFDKRYAKSRTLRDGPERDRLYHEMTRIMEVDGAWLLLDSRVRNSLQQPNVIGFTKHPVLHAEWGYIDLDPRPAY
ncbi:MAG TPA: ABC transporter substrate-binding protein [Burkholderiales bacterium]|nr:ABC transporter substrate-binding protein [Burkholderiales bacterium]